VVKVPVRSTAFTGCLKTVETTRWRPVPLEFNYYAPGVRDVLTVDAMTADGLELVRIKCTTQARRSGMRQIRALAVIVLVATTVGAPLVGAQGNSCDGDLNHDDQVTIDELVKAVSSALGGCVYNPTIDPADFVAAVDNPYLPWIPGTVFHYRSAQEEITVTVTHDTKVIVGVTCTVVHDVVTEDGEVTEDTFDWYAQDKAGNVWYFGEDTKTLENGQVVSTEGSWEAGVNDAKPGIIMRAGARVGDAYRQEYAPGTALDRAEVIAVGESVTVSAGSFDHCIKTRESSDLTPGDIENKFYCPNVGEVLAVTSDGEREELTSIEQP
jgi:hypothetical protein